MGSKNVMKCINFHKVNAEQMLSTFLHDAEIAEKLGFKIQEAVLIDKVKHYRSVLFMLHDLKSAIFCDGEDVFEQGRLCKRPCQTSRTVHVCESRYG